MAPLAMPPGPYFEQLLRNGFLSYTDAFNYHFYGCAADFTGVYRAFEDAVKRYSLSVGRCSVGDGRHVQPRPPTSGQRVTSNDSRVTQKHLPVLLTEYGYNRLTGPQSHTVAGRVAQWRWFRDVGKQIEDLRIAGPMAFYLPPYPEGGALEFGLTMAPAAPAPLSVTRYSDHGSENNEERVTNNPAPAQPERFTAGGLTFTREDFAPAEPASLSVTRDSERGSANNKERTTQNGAAGAPAPWMRRIGTAIGGNEASPALAWLIQEGIDHPYAPRDWTVSVPEPSPVVIDFVAAPSLVQYKHYSGYVAAETVADASEGAGELILYNFSAVPQRGRLEGSPRDLLTDPTALDHEFDLAPMARVTVPVRFRILAALFVRHDWSVRFVPSDPGRPPSAFATALYPNLTGMSERVVADLGALSADPDAAGGNRALLLRRRIEPGEATVRPVDGTPWLVTDGDGLMDQGKGSWAFTVAPFAGDSIPAVAELPLPDDFVFPEDALLALRFRLAEPAGTTYATGKYLHIYFRTANGNLYGVMPWSRASGEWSRDLEAKGNYTLMLDGRVNPPWRFRDNRIVSIVLMSWRRNVPMRYEIEGARIGRLGR